VLIVDFFCFTSQSRMHVRIVHAFQMMNSWMISWEHLNHSGGRWWTIALRLRFDPAFHTKKVQATWHKKKYLDDRALFIQHQAAARVDCTPLRRGGVVSKPFVIWIHRSPSKALQPDRQPHYRRCTKRRLAYIHLNIIVDVSYWPFLFLCLMPSGLLGRWAVLVCE